MTLSTEPSRFLQRLQRDFRSDLVSTAPEDLREYGKDWTTAIAPDPFAVAWPRSTEEVSQLLKLCSEFGVPVVPSGGRTGLAAGAVARHGELVVNLSKMNRIDAVSPAAQTLRVQAGAVTQRVHEAAAAAGLIWPIDLAAKGSSQIGGNINTNAGGVRVIRYGHTRHWVQSLEVVLMSGQVLELNGNLEKNNTGYDLRHLMIGSEGTLGIVTEATLKLTRPPQEKRVFFFALDSMARVLELLRATRAQPAPILAFECLTRACLEAVLEKRGFAEPFAQHAPFYVLVEVEVDGAPNLMASLEEFLTTVFSTETVVDGTLAQSTEAARRLWEYRENITESLSLMGRVYKNDLALPIDALEEFTTELFRDFSAWYGDCRLFVFGHIGDGNLHINVLKPASMDAAEFLSLCERVNDSLFGLVKKYRGSIAAEHGIGLLKKNFLSYSRDAKEIELFRLIKSAFDPRGLLNPGKIFEL